MRPPARPARPVSARRAVVVVSGLLLALAACAPSSSVGPAEPSTSAAQVTEHLTQSRPGRDAYVVVPDDPAAVVVVVPGGAWQGVDPTGLRLLGSALAEQGLAAVTVTYGTASSGDHFPGPAQDVACGVAFAAQQVPDVPVVLVGHSAGAHLALLVGLRPDQGGQCDHAPRAADGVVGLAGPYDVAATGTVGQNLFGVPLAQDPEAWAEGNPLTWVAERPDVPVLLVHGEDDVVVRPSATEVAADALTEAGHAVVHRTYPDVDHLQVIDPRVVADDVVSWVTALAGS